MSRVGKLSSLWPFFVAFSTVGGILLSVGYFLLNANHGEGHLGDDSDDENGGGPGILESLAASTDVLCQGPAKGDTTTIDACPARLQRPAGVVHDVNVWHFHMLNDADRNEFYWQSLEGKVHEKRVVVIGSGSGILEMIAAKHGAAHVDGMEAIQSLQEVAVQNVVNNDLADKVQIHHKHSTEFKYGEEDELADVLISEIFGLSWLSERTVESIVDARTRLIKPGGHVIPETGSECVTLLQSEVLWRKHSVDKWRGINLKAMNVFTDTYRFGWFRKGFHLGAGFSQTKWRIMAPRTTLHRVDFKTVTSADFPRRESVKIIATESGPIHALVVSWEVFAGHTQAWTMNTHLDGVYHGGSEARWHHDSAWGQLYKIVAEEQDAENPWSTPREFIVERGEELFVDFVTQVDGLSHLYLRRARDASASLSAFSR